MAAHVSLCEFFPIVVRVGRKKSDNTVLRGSSNGAIEIRHGF